MFLVTLNSCFLVLNVLYNYTVKLAERLFTGVYTSKYVEKPFAQNAWKQRLSVSKNVEKVQNIPQTIVKYMH